jgi:hypothetical protein
MPEQITESRLAWIRFFLVRLFWTDERLTTPLELSQQEAIASLKEEIQLLNTTLAEVRSENERKAKSHANEIERLITKSEMQQEEIDLAGEMHARIMLKVQAESAAYATRIPPEAK